MRNYVPSPPQGRSVTVTNVTNLDDNQYLAKIDQQVGRRRST
jgi:hypothetical protein